MRRALRQAWELDDAGKAEQLIRNLARRLEQEAPGVIGSILEGIDEILTVMRLELPHPTPPFAGLHQHHREHERARSGVCAATSSIGGTPAMALRWTGAAMQEAAKGFRRLKAHKQLPVLRAALIAIRQQNEADRGIVTEVAAA